MTVLIAAAALVVIGLAVALALGALPRMSVYRTDPISSAGGRPLPAGGFLSDDVADLRFDLAVRGYRMDQVDEAVERLRQRIAELEDMLAENPSALPAGYYSGHHEHEGARSGDSFSDTSIAMFPPVGPTGEHRRGHARPYPGGAPASDDRPTEPPTA